MADTCTRCGMEAKYSIILSTYSASASGQRQVRFCAECYADHRAWLSARIPSCDAEIERMKGDQDLLRDVVHHRDELMRERDEAQAAWAGVTEQWKHALGKLDEATEEIATLRLAIGTPPDAQVLSPLSVSPAEPMLICPSCQCAWPGLMPGRDDTVTCSCGRLLGCAMRDR